MVKKLYTLILAFLSYTLLAGTYYVAPTTATPAGNDNNAGTISAPWATWAKGMSSRSHGDIVYFRGGVYPTTVVNGRGVRVSATGTVSDSIFFLNYPGERPILDCSAASATTTYGSNNLGLQTNFTYVHVRGLIVRNVWQKYNGVRDGYAEARGWEQYGSNSVYENCTCYNTHGRGFWVGAADRILYLNCDSYNNCDSLTAAYPGNDGYGWFVEDQEDTTRVITIRKCRAWRCGDDGFTCYSRSHVIFDGCWSMYNGALEGEGHGFKLGWQTIDVNNSVRRVVKNCIAVWNYGHGITTNDNNLLTSGMQVYNNTLYHNLHNPFFGYDSYGVNIYNTSTTDAQELNRTFKNNLCYDNAGGAIFVGPNALYTHDHNSWDATPSVTVNGADFASLDTTGLASPRSGDHGTLPNMPTFLHLVVGSDLINKGTDVGMAYNGTAPDLGAFEYGTQSGPSNATDILTASVLNISGTVNATNHTVILQVPYGASLTALAPVMTLSFGATINPVSGSARDFTNAVTYAVTAEDGTTSQTWTITMTVAPVKVTFARDSHGNFVKDSKGHFVKN